MIGSLVLALTVAAGDPCAPVSAGPDDPAAAAEYRAVGDAELSLGRRDTAEAAYRAAAARDPADAASRAALARLCAESASHEDLFEKGVRRMDDGDLRGAVAAFRDARAAGPDPSAALLEGICHYELGEDAEAEALLAQAERAPAHREEAAFYRGLVALRAGDGSGAVRLFESAASNPALERLARDLARSAREEGRVVMSFVIESGWDSNVNLAPSGDALVARDSDGAVAIGAGLTWRPGRATGPYLRATGSLHEQLTLGAYDFGAVDGAGGWQLRHGRWWGLGEYGYGYRTLGGEPFVGAHRLLASGGTTRGRVGLSATVLGRVESYRGPWSGFSGTLGRAEVRASVALGAAARVALAYGGGRDDTDDDVLSYVDHGPTVELRVLLSRRTRLTFEAGATFRRYDELDVAFGARRDDVLLDGLVAGELELARGWTARLGLLGRQSFSNVAAFDYAKVVPSLGLSYATAR